MAVACTKAMCLHFAKSFLSSIFKIFEIIQAKFVFLEFNLYSKLCNAARTVHRGSEGVEKNGIMGVTQFRSDPIGQVRWNQDLADRWREEGYWLDATLAGLTHEILDTKGDRIAIIEGEQKYTIRELWDEARKLADGLLDRGCGNGRVLSYQLPNWYEASVINLAAAMIGSPVNPLVPIYREAELAFMLDDVSARMVFVPDTFRGVEYSAMLKRVAKSIDGDLEVVVVRGQQDGCISYVDLLTSAKKQRPLPQVDPDSIFVMMHTSGTTGRPKCVLHSHNSFLVQARIHPVDLGGSPPNVQIVATPISHIAGIILSNIYPFLADTPVVLMDRWSAEEAIRLIKRHNGTALGGATPFLRQLVDAAKAAGELLPSLTRTPVGGAAVPPDLVREAQEWFPNVTACRIYGCTEVPTATSGSAGRDDIEHGAETDGQVRHVDVRIVDPLTGAEVPAGSDGEILLRGPQMMLGYLRAEDNDGVFDKDGYFLTGDIGRIVDGDYLTITGRKKDLIIRLGENLSPKEIEDALHTHQQIEAAAVVGMPDAVTGERVCAFIVTRGQVNLSLQDLDDFLLAAGLSRRKAPEHLILVDALPVSLQGKVMKQDLRKRAAEIAKTSIPHDH